MATRRVTVTNPHTGFSRSFVAASNVSDDRAALRVIEIVEDETPIEDLPEHKGDWKVDIEVLPRGQFEF